MDPDAIVTQYKALRGSKGLRDRLLVEYRCAKKCLLLHVWSTPEGALYYRPAVDISAGMQQRTGATEVGRVPERGGAIADLDAGQWVWITDEQERNGIGVNWLLIGCTHCLGLRFPVATIKTDIADATPGHPVKVCDFWASPNPPTQ